MKMNKNMTGIASVAHERRSGAFRAVVTGSFCAFSPTTA